MKKKVNYYDVIPFLDSCVDAYCKLAKFDRNKLKPASTPFHELRTAKPVPDGSTNQGGKLQPIASKILLKILFAARMALDMTYCVQHNHLQVGSQNGLMIVTLVFIASYVT